MQRYIFTEEEWMQWPGTYSDTTLVGLEGEEYGLVKHTGIDGGLPGASTADRFLGVNVFGPGGVYESHVHETPMFYYVLTGTAKMRVGEEERVVGKGAWVYTPPGLPHYTENVGDDDLAYILFGGNPVDAESTAHEMVSSRLHGGC